jgi:hypothetical protein
MRIIVWWTEYIREQFAMAIIIIAVSDAAKADRFFIELFLPKKLSSSGFLSLFFGGSGMPNSPIDEFQSFAQSISVDVWAMSE